MSYRLITTLRQFNLTLLLVLIGFQFQAHASSNVLIRVMAANLTSGSNQRYETPGLNILKGLKPDVVAIQEFNYQSTAGLGLNTPVALREMMDATFGTNFVYFRESGTGYSIPNGIISRWPFVNAGTWDDVQVPDRGFAWAQIDLPGTNDLYIISVHLHSGGGASSRAIEATNLTALIQSNFPTNAWIIVAGDFNTDNRVEPALTKFKTRFSDDKIPLDQSSDPDTNANRNKPYDYVLPAFSFTNALVPVAIGTNQFRDGLVFDSRVYRPLNDVPPVVSTDSGVFQMQHMAVVKDFKITLPDTVSVPPAAPLLSQLTLTAHAFGFTLSGTPGTNYVIQASTNLAGGNWIPLRTNAAPFTFTESNANAFPQRYYRAVWQP